MLKQLNHEYRIIWRGHTEYFETTGGAAGYLGIIAATLDNYLRRGNNEWIITATHWRRGGGRKGGSGIPQLTDADQTILVQRELK